MWQHIAGWLFLLVEPDAAVVMWYKAGSSPWNTYIYLNLFTFFTTVLIFWGIGSFKKMDFVRLPIQKNITKLTRLLPFRQKIESGHNLARGKITKWLKRQKTIVIFISSCIPIVPVIPSATAITAKLLEIKHGLIIILIGAAIRNALTVISIYRGISFFFS